MKKNKNDYSISVYAIIKKGGRVLLTEDHYRHGWKLPGGGVQPKELLLDALVRETKEEVGFNIKPTSLIYISNWFNKEKGEVRLRIYFIAKIKSGVIKFHDGEVKEAKWFTKRQLKSLKEKDFLFPHHYFVAVQSYLKCKEANIIVKKDAKNRYNLFITN
ncbi:MAG: NUDIX hydrolase [Candidatus Giovannonibacteria bacterium]|nr:MAG: NUDIX hydrolase [Candidatus Giovannonibacteria bacterium]